MFMICMFRPIRMKCALCVCAWNVHVCPYLNFGHLYSVCARCKILHFGSRFLSSHPPSSLHRRHPPTLSLYLEILLSLLFPLLLRSLSVFPQFCIHFDDIQMGTSGVTSSHWLVAVAINYDYCIPRQVCLVFSNNSSEYDNMPLRSNWTATSLMVFEPPKKALSQQSG